MNKGMNNHGSAVLENPDLIRIIGEYLLGSQLPFVLSSKGIRDALKPLGLNPGTVWIKSKKKYFVVSILMVLWAQSIGCEFDLTTEDNSLFTDVASNGSVDVLRWLHKKYPPSQYPAGVCDYVFGTAAEHGHIELLEYLRTFNNFNEYSHSICQYAARGDKIRIIQWLRELLGLRCPWDPWICTSAASAGKLHALEWLRSQDPPCPWSVHTCYYATNNGHLNVLKWLRSQDPPCPWNRQECIDAARYYSYHEVVEWILNSTN